MSLPSQKRSEGDDSTWTTEHHLVGNKTTHNLLISAGADFEQVDAYIMSTECVEASSFEPENLRDRKPALWRTCIPDPRVGRPSLAIDLVASDWQQQKDTPNWLPTKQHQDVVTERLDGIILEHIYTKILPDLLLKAALEEVRAHFLRSAETSSNNNGSRRPSSSSSSSKTSSDIQTPPLYYTKHPNSYLKPPEVSEKEPSTTAIVQFTPSNLLNRIKAGCALAWTQIENIHRPVSMHEINTTSSSDHRRASSRIARIVEQKEQQVPANEETRYLWGVIAGGTIASFLLDTQMASTIDSEKESKKYDEIISITGEEEGRKAGDDNRHGHAATNGKEDETVVENGANTSAENGGKQIVDDGDGETDLTKLNNPYMQPSDFAVLEWLGRKTAKLLSNSDLQRLFPSLMAQRKGKKKKKDYCGVSGRRALPLLTSIDKQVWDRVVSPASCFEDSTARFVFESASHEDVSDIDRWETAYFGRAHFSLRIADETEKGPNKRKPIDNFQQVEREFKERKTWEITRYKAIHSGCTLWSSWPEAVLEWKTRELDSSKESSTVDEQSPNGSSHDQDLAVAKALAAEADTSNIRRRTTRRGGDTSGVFYGNQSGLTLKQLMETLLRMVSQKAITTLPDLLERVPDESTDPMRRMRNALGRLVWKRNQMSQLRVNTEWTDVPVRQPVFSSSILSSSKIPSTAVDDVRELLAYIAELHHTELQLRRLITQLLSRLPISLVASAGDERPGTMDSADNESFQEPDSIQWQSTGHHLIGSNIFRPAKEFNVDGNAPCQWFLIESYTPSVLLDPEERDSMAQEKPLIGLAKDNMAVERRARFHAVPSTGDAASFATDPLILTEAQVVAGLKAGEMQNASSSSDRGEDHPFAGEAGAKIAFIPTSTGTFERQIHGEVVGWESVCDEREQICHKVLVLPVQGPGAGAAFWASLAGSEQGGLTCTVEGRSEVYTVEQFDYHSSSPAFKECRAIISHLQRHNKSSPFLQPVDPVALNIPNYFSVIKHPMDIQTLSEKLERGEYSNIHPKEAIGRTPISRMLNGPFRKDVELIFDNAIAFNPPDDWIYQAAIVLKKYALKKIEQACAAADEYVSGRRRPQTSAYVEYDSDVDMYTYESEKDDDYEDSRHSRKRKESRSGWSGEDTASKAIERVVKLQKVLGDSQGLRAPLSHLPINSNAATFSLSSVWTCRRSKGSNQDRKVEAVDGANELSELVALRSHVEEKQVSGLRRSTRSNVEPQSENGSSKGDIPDLTYIHKLLDKLSDPSCDSPRNRIEVECARERIHEEFHAKTYHTYFAEIVAAIQEMRETENQKQLIGLFTDGCFPPFLGKVTPLSPPSYKDEVTWEIRTPNIIPAIRWVIRGLIASGHFTEIEPMTSDSMQSGAVIPSNAYYIDPRIVPFDVLHQKEIQRRKRANQGESDDDEKEEIELSEYEKRRAERVARNADRLKSLGLA
ncbi:hypothetical protein ACA910_002734 [Epithemia clementina (nom. ined.)]